MIASIKAGVATGLTGNPNAPSTSTDNQVTWSRATHLAFLQQPTDTVYGNSINPAVTVQVLDDERRPRDRELGADPAVARSGRTDPSRIDPVNAVNGIATFTDLTINQVVGAFTLQADSPGLASAVSTPFRMLPAPSTITANNQTKPYGTTFTFTGTEFTVSGLVPGDAVTSLSIASVGAPAAAPVSGSPYRDRSLRRGRPGPRQLRHHLRRAGAMTVTPAALTITAKDQTKAYGTTFAFAGTEFTVNGLLGDGRLR